MKKLVLAAAAGALMLACNAQAAAWFNASVAANGESDASGYGNPADFSTQTYTVSGGYNFVSLLYKNTQYDFSGSQDYFDSLQLWRLDLNHQGRFSNSGFGYFMGLGLGIGYESDIDFSEDYEISPRAGLSYDFTPAVTAYLGMNAQFNEVDNTFLPIVGLKIGDASDYGWSGSIAYPATRLTYRFNDFLALNGTFDTVRETYRLADDSKLQRKGYIQDHSYGASAYLDITPIRAFTISAGVSTQFDRTYKIYNEGGDKVGEWDADANLGGFIKGKVNF